jgi:long-chain acyl-CoA synthetase
MDVADMPGSRPDSLPGLVRFWAARNPEGAAVRQGQESLSYEALDDRVDALARSLRGRGLNQGDTVMLIGLNSIPWVAAFLACLRLGAIVAPTNNRITPSQMLDQAEALDAKLVLHDAEHLDVLAKVVEAGVQPLDLFELYADLTPVGGGDLTCVSSSSSAFDPALVSFTSGTTGVPKGAVISHGALAEMSRMFAEYFGSSTTDTTLVMVPLFHNTGFVDQFGHMLAAGGCTGLLPRYGTTAATQELQEHPVTFLAAVPSMARMLMTTDGADRVFSQLRTIMYGGSPMPGAWSDELRARYPHLQLVHAYGLSEFTSVCTFLPHELVADKGESVGLPLPGVEVRVVDDRHNDVPAGSVGEVWLSGPTMMSGYWRRPDLTAQKISNGWLHTGDLGHLDAQGLLWLDGRVDDVINRGGEKILPAYVESCLARLSDVAEASVFGYSDPILQQRVGAAVQPHAGGSFDEEAARALLSTLLPDYAIPDRWVVYDALPLTGSGKVDRRAVVREVEASLAPHVLTSIEVS